MKQLSIIFLFFILLNGVWASPGNQVLSMEDAADLGIKFELAPEKDKYECRFLKIRVPKYLPENPKASVGQFFFYKISKNTGNAVFHAQVESESYRDFHQVDICFKPNKEFQSRFSFFYREEDSWPGYPDYLIIEDLNAVYESLITKASAGVGARTRLPG